eukprot:CAMPEP_0114513144 /NCGR_PEP_ID=MMETSP0109-20121206/15392_1 /TAXON_ID=29199 /ORGANISM="Chlorarachnion reptans, Strain CCCM449" /LENGTH=205 /DNA_ID=CAMNT_0001692955 /DNA_START=214 /DNA_END=828 /DNA_ORIENTATION=-
MGALVDKQASVQRYIRPATWVSYCKSFHDWSLVWHFETKIQKKKVIGGAGLIGKNGTQIRPSRSGAGGRRVSSRGKAKKSSKLTSTERYCESIKNIIEQAIGKDKDLPEKSVVTRERNVVTVSMLTGSARWLNVIDLTVEKNPSLEQGGYIVKAKASSTGILPMYVPLAPVLNTALFWAPFPDNGSNKENLLKLEKVLLQKRDQW